MASQSLALNETPQDLFAALSLDTSKTWTVQNTGDRRLFFWESDAAPSPSSVRALYLIPGEYGEAKAPASGSFWVWSDEPTTVGVLESF